MRLTDEEIEAAKSARGGWTRKTLAGWGVSWPPVKGWRRALVEGRSIPKAKKAARKIAQFRRRHVEMDRRWRDAMDREA